MEPKDYMIHDDTQIKGFFDCYRWLSNFHLCQVHYQGAIYPSSEHAYQAAKYPKDQREPFYYGPDSLSPVKCKKLGSAALINVDCWNAKRYDVMQRVVFDKFKRNLDLRCQLMGTGDKYLEETNHWGDCYWGVCAGVGDNRLGKILMATRAYWVTLGE